MKTVPIIVLLFYIPIHLCSQSLPIIKAATDKASLREGDILRKDYWTITPSVNPDR